MSAARDVANNPGEAGTAGRRRAQWKARRWLWKGSQLGRVRSCGHHAAQESVTIATRGDRAHFSGLVTCGSVHVCPVCSERIWAERAGQLQQLLDVAHADGLKVAFVTLTMQHSAGQPLAESWDAMAKAWANARGGQKAARDRLKACGVVGIVRRTEATWGRANGWHPHVHALVFHRVGTPEAIGQAMHAAWKGSLERNGRDSWRDAGGLDAKALTLGEAAAAIAGYATKGMYEVAALDSRDAALEVAGSGRGKFGARGNVTPWGLLDAAIGGDPEARYLWGEWELATKGRRALDGVARLAKTLGVDLDERSDEDIAAENDGDQVDVCVMPAEDFAHLREHDGGLHLLGLLEVIEGARPGRRYAAAVAYAAVNRLGVMLLEPGDEWARTPRQRRDGQHLLA